MGFRNCRGGTLPRNAPIDPAQQSLLRRHHPAQKLGERYPGIHEPLIDTALFEPVQAVFKAKAQKLPQCQVQRPEFIYRQC